MGSLFLLQGIFPTQGSNPGLWHCRHIGHQLSHRGSPRILEWAACPFCRASSQPRSRTRFSCIAAAAAHSLQSCPTLCDPIDISPPGSPAPGILQARTLEWVAYFLLQCMKVKSESEVAQSCPTLSTPWTTAYQADSLPTELSGKPQSQK